MHTENENPEAPCRQPHVWDGNTELRSENDKASLSLQPREDRGIGTAAGIQNL